MTWQPGTPVRTAQDEATWKAWRAESKRLRQRERRARSPRIDYYPSEEAAEAIRLVWASGTPGLCSALDRIVIEWAAARRRAAGEDTNSTPPPRPSRP